LWVVGCCGGSTIIDHWASRNWDSINSEDDRDVDILKCCWMERFGFGVLGHATFVLLTYLERVGRLVLKPESEAVVVLVFV